MLAKKVYRLCTDHPARVRLVKCVVAARMGTRRKRGCVATEAFLATNLASVTAWPTKLFETLFPRYDGAQKSLAHREEF